MNVDVRIDRDMAPRLARRLSKTALDEAAYFPSIEEADHLGRGPLLMYWLVVVGICQQTAALRGVVNGLPSRGSEYLFRRGFESLLANPDEWTAARVATWSEDDLARIISDTGKAKDTTVDRLEARARLARDIGAQIVRDFRGDPERLLPPKSLNVGAAYGALAKFEAYSDPLRKKSALLLLTMGHLGLIKLSDPERLDMPVDYHLMRVYLRTGLVVVENREWAADLRDRKPATAGQEEAIRSACVEASRALVAENVATLMHLDALLWNIGRTCCAREHAPYCKLDRRCPNKPESCSLIQSFKYECPEACPLEGVCRTSLNELEQRNPLVEPLIETHYY